MKYAAIILLTISSFAIAETKTSIPAPGEGLRVHIIELEGFEGFNTGKPNHPLNQMVGYAPFYPVQLDKDLALEWLVKEWRKNHWPSSKHWCQNTHRAILYAFDDDGKKLWKYSQGPGVEIGYGYCPVLAWDVDDDGIDDIFARHVTDPKTQWPLPDAKQTSPADRPLRKSK